MKIALDYDHTFTKDPIFWQKFIDTTILADHNIWIVTSRSEDLPIEHNVKNVDGVIYCNFFAKRMVTLEHNIDIDIWIDDDPRWIEDSHRGEFERRF